MATTKTQPQQLALPIPLQPGASLIIAPQLTAENLKAPELRDELKAILKEAMAEREDEKKLLRGVTGKTAAKRLEVGRTTFYRGLKQVPEAVLAEVRLPTGRWKWPGLEEVWHKHVKKSAEHADAAT